MSNYNAGSWDVLDSASTSTTSSFDSPYYISNFRLERIREPPVKLKKSRPERPLAYLRAKEEELKNGTPSFGMPQEPIMFDPKDLVLGE